MFDYWWILVIINVFLIIYNIFYNKRLVLTLLLVVMDAFITYIINASFLRHVEGIAGIDVRVFLLISILITMVMIIALFKFKFNKRWLSFVTVIIFNIIFWLINILYYSLSGAILSADIYFKYNFRDFLFMINLSLIQVSLFINYISQKKND